MNIRHISLITLAATLAACSAMPERNSALDLARGRFNAAQRDAQVVKLAPEELNRAGESLAVADQAWTDSRPKETVDHLAYMTNQRVVIAQETASSRASQAVTAGAAAEREQMRLASRSRETEAARQQLAQSQQDNARKTAELDRREARVNDLEAQLKDLNARKTDRGIVVTLGDVLFESGQSRLTAQGARNTLKLADVFRTNPDRSASIEGYTDSVGGAQANDDLSQRRANTVMKELVNLGVPADRLSTRAHGEQNPVSSNATAAGRQMNRRVEIVFLPLREELIAR